MRIGNIILGFTGGMGALYYGQVGWQVYQSTAEERLIINRRDAELAAAKTAQANIARDEKRVVLLQEELHTRQDALASIDEELNALRKQVADVESKRNAEQKAALETAANMEKCRKQMEEAAADLKRRRENAKVAESGLLGAMSQVQAAKEMYNPLRHPLLRSFMDK